MGVKCWNHVINSYSKLSCIFYSLTFIVDMKYMSMLDIWNQSFYVFLVGVGAAISAFYFCLLVCFSAFAVCIFSDEDRGCCLLSNENQSVYMPWMQNKTQKTAWYDLCISHFEVTSHPHGLRDGLKCQLSTSAKF